MPAKATAFHFEGLPRVPAISVGRSRAIARGLAGAEGLRTITARGLGRISLTVDAIEPAPWRPGVAQHPSPESAFTLVRGDGSAGCLTVERFFALSLVRAALSAPTPPVLRPLSPSERGVLAAMVAGALAGAGRSGLRVSLDRPRPVDERERVSINIGVRASGTSGTATLDAPMSWFPTEAVTLRGEAAVLLETVLRVELGRTELAGGAYLAAELGDAVVFEGVSAPRDDQPWACELWIGSKKTQAEILPDGDLRPTGAFFQGGGAPEPGMSDKDARDKGGEGISAEGAAILASAPVEVVAEIGRVPMRGDEVLGLINGVVLSLGERKRDLVTLRVGGRIWARGELVNIDDDLGVRITEILRQR
jgi:flagellar motor switch/type III secretory pathway protein FliN